MRRRTARENVTPALASAVEADRHRIDVRRDERLRFVAKPVAVDPIVSANPVERPFVLLCFCEAVKRFHAEDEHRIRVRGLHRLIALLERRCMTDLDWTFDAELKDVRCRIELLREVVVQYQFHAFTCTIVEPFRKAGSLERSRLTYWITRAIFMVSNVPIGFVDPDGRKQSKESKHE